MASADKSVTNIAERQVRIYRYTKIAAIVMAVLLPFTLYFASIAINNGKNVWSFEPIRESIVTGRFLSDPGAAIFQSPQLISNTSSERHIAETVGSYLVLAFLLFIAIAVVFLFARLIIVILVGGKDKFLERKTLRPTPGTPTPLTDGIFGAMSLERGEEIVKSKGRTWTIATAGRSVIAQTTINERLPFVLIASADNGIEAREKINISKNRLLEIVTDPTSYDHFHGYVIKGDMNANIPGAFDSNVSAIIMKHLNGVDIIIEGTVVTVFLASASIKSDVDFDRRLEALNDVIVAMANKQGSKFAKGFVHYVPTYLIQDNVYLAVGLAIAASYGLITFFIPSGPTVSDLLVVSTGIGWVYVWAFMRTARRRRILMRGWYGGKS